MRRVRRWLDGEKMFFLVATFGTGLFPHFPGLMTRGSGRRIWVHSAAWRKRSSDEGFEGATPVRIHLFVFFFYRGMHLHAHIDK